MTYEEELLEEWTVAPIRSTLRKYMRKKFTLEKAVEDFNGIHESLIDLKKTFRDDNSEWDQEGFDFGSALFKALEAMPEASDALLEISAHFAPLQEIIQQAQREFRSPIGTINAIKNPKRYDLVARLSDARAKTQQGAGNHP